MIGPRIGRRAVGLAVLSLGCSRQRSSEAGARDAAAPLVQEELRFDGAASTRALVLAPASGGPFPILVALHGRGEAVRGAEVGAHGWLRDYKLDRSIAAVSSGRLTRDDLEGLVDDPERARWTRDLAAHPYRGLVVVCPHTPDILAGTRSLHAADAFVEFVVDALLPRVRERFSTTGAVGVDGVSLGGRISLLAAARRPEAWRAVGALQPAVREAEIPAFVDELGSFRRRSSAPLRLVTSTADPFRPAVLGLDRELTRLGLDHEAVTLPGPHDYSFNRGPGGVSMLLFHDRALRRA